jgi:hypothetical protein
MTLRMFSIIGESLNFGARRLELIARVAWLPVLLILIVDMSAMFAYLSVIAGRVVTFADVNSFLQAEQYLTQYSARGWAGAPEKMALIAGVNLTLKIILISSFIAPLIRYAGLGERPRPGLIRLPFGADQVRFLIAGLASIVVVLIVVAAPIAGASFFVMKAIVEAMSQTMASFPDPDSLHTIKLVSSGEGVIASGGAWMFDIALPLAAAAPFALLVWLIGVVHFHPGNRPHAGEGGNLFLRVLVVFAVTGALAGSAFFLLRGAAVQSIGQSAGGESGLAGTPVHAVLIFGVLALMLVAYFNLRLFPWPGVAVCRRSLAPGPTLAVTRGWNLLRLPVILVLIGGFLLTMTLVINVIILPAILSTLNVLFEATEASTRLVNSGAKGEWVRPLFVWIWNLSKIGVNFLWTFFSYGVVAGLYGRLYRESAEAA